MWKLATGGLHICSDALNHWSVSQIRTHKIIWTLQIKVNNWNWEISHRSCISALFWKNRDYLATRGSCSQMPVAILLEILIPCPLGLQCYYLHASLNLPDFKSIHVYDVRQWSHSIFLNRMNPFPANIYWTVLRCSLLPLLYMESYIHKPTTSSGLPILFYCSFALPTLLDYIMS